MKISQLIQQLKQIRQRKGNIDVVYKDAEFGETDIHHVDTRTEPKDNKFFYKNTTPPIAVITSKDNQDRDHQ